MLVEISQRDHALLRVIGGGSAVGRDLSLRRRQRRIEDRSMGCVGQL